ncbi:hypothetical protein AAMO2058_000553100 [Amorphochlora amoebiformis]
MAARSFNCTRILFLSSNNVNISSVLDIRRGGFNPLSTHREPHNYCLNCGFRRPNISQVMADQAAETKARGSETTPGKPVNGHSNLPETRSLEQSAAASGSHEGIYPDRLQQMGGESKQADSAAPTSTSNPALGGLTSPLAPPDSVPTAGNTHYREEKSSDGNQGGAKRQRTQQGQPNPGPNRQGYAPNQNSYGYSYPNQNYPPQQQSQSYQNQYQNPYYQHPQYAAYYYQQQQYYPGAYPNYGGGYPQYPPGGTGGMGTRPSVPGGPGAGAPFGGAGKPCNTLYVSNLSESTHQQQITSLFMSQPGYVTSNFSVRPGKPPLAFIQYMDTNLASNALRALNGWSVNGKSILITYARSEMKARTRPPATPMGVSTLYLSSLPTTTTEEELKDLLSKQPGFISVKLSSANNGINVLQAFAKFSSHENASVALRELPKEQIHGKPLTVAYAKSDSYTPRRPQP